VALHRRSELKRSKPARRARSTADPQAFSEKTKTRALNRFNRHCALCERRTVVYHHRQMRSQQGPGTFENCLPVCQYHHRQIHDHPDWATRHGLLVRSWDDPRHVRVFHHCPIACTQDHVGS